MNQSINTDSKNIKEPQQKYRLGTVSIKILKSAYDSIRVISLYLVKENNENDLSFCRRNVHVERRAKLMMYAKVWSK